jgi:site-specific recombinase XerD
MSNAACLLAAGRSANTWIGYTGKLKLWEDFCACTGVRPFPAQPSHVLCYLGYLQEEGSVKVGSLQPYLSTINSWHTYMGLSKPVVGQAVNMLRRG